MDTIVESDYLKVLNSIQKANGYEIVELDENSSTVKFSLENAQTYDDSKTIFESDIYKCASFCAMVAVNEPNIFIINSNVDFLAQVDLEHKEIIFKAKALSSSRGKNFIEVFGKVNDISIFVGNFTVLKLDSRSKIK